MSLASRHAHVDGVHGSCAHIANLVFYRHGGGDRHGIWFQLKRFSHWLSGRRTGGMALWLPLLMLSACKEEAQWKTKVFVDRTASSVMGEIFVPTELWKRLIDPDRPLHDLINISTVPTPNQGGGDSAIQRASVETELQPVVLYLIEQTRGVLGGRNQRIAFGPGGGDIDLRDFIEQPRGSFRVVFEFMTNASEKASRRVWYLSNAKRRRVGPDWVGAGCESFMDITSAVGRANAQEGLLVAIGDDRHVSALAGTFFFAVKDGGRVQVSRISVFDSSKRKLQCRPR